MDSLPDVDLPSLSEDDDDDTVRRLACSCPNLGLVSDSVLDGPSFFLSLHILH